VGEAIVITSGKGGVGKTTATLNIGASLALKGAHVMLVDTDIGLRNLDVVMGLEDKIVYDLVDVVEGKCRLRQALVEDPRFFGRLHLLPAAQTRDKNVVTAEQMRKLVSELTQSVDYVLIDCPAGIEQGFQNAVAGADSAVVVTMPEVSAVRDADRVIGLLRTFDLPAPRLVINRIRAGMVRRGDMMSTKDMLEVLGCELLGIIPDDETVIKAGNLGEPVARGNTQVSLAYRNIAARILGEEVPFQRLTGAKDNFIKRLMLKFGC
jgi:septum site-determining protein MinD